MPADIAVFIIEPEYRLRLHYRSLFKRTGFAVAGEAQTVGDALPLVKGGKAGLVMLHAGTWQEELPALQELTGICPVLLVDEFSTAKAQQAAKAGVYACLPEEVPDEAVRSAALVACARFGERQALAQEAEELRDLLALRKVLDQAKGILMKKHHMSEQEAHRRIQRYAMHKRLTVKSVAEAIIKATGGRG